MTTIVIDGSYGEGGGQILRSALALSAWTGIPVHIERIRAGRDRPGLRPQHLTAVRAAAAICDAGLSGDALGSESLHFEPQARPQPGSYEFNVADATEGGSAGAVTLVLQTVLLPLAVATGPSRIVLRGGTAVPASPPAIYIERVYLPTLFDMGTRAQLEHRLWGFFPVGGGLVTVDLPGRSVLRARAFTERGELERVEGLAFAARLPSHIPQRMANRAHAILHKAGLPARIQPQHVPASGTGAGLFLLAEYSRGRAGFLALGRQGLPSEAVAEAACHALLAHHETEAALDPFLADQLLLPFALADGESRATTSSVTRHLLTQAWVIEQFGLASVHIEGELHRPGMVIVTPC